jgi:hypothetical protein
MQISGKVTQLLPIQTGTGKNGVWEKREIILKPFDEKCKEIAVIVWGENCHHQDLMEDRDISIECYISSTEYQKRWNTQIIGTKFLKIENVNKSSCEYEIQLIIEEIIFPDKKRLEMYEKVKSLMKNYYFILGKSLDKYQNLIYIGLGGNVDISNLKIGEIITVPVEIESSLNYGWKTRLFADRFELFKT